jgi:molybdopterin converting factor small subunit
MPQATFWFSSPFREWLGQRTLTIHWEDRITLQEVLERLGAAHPAFRANVTGGGLTQPAFDHLAAVIVDGDFLALPSTIPDGAEVHVFTPLAGGVDPPTKGRTRVPVRDVCLTLPPYKC